MVKLTKIYTRGGDKGETSLGDGTRLAKHHPRVAAYGAVDEANAAIGVARATPGVTPDIDRILANIQHDLFDLGADLCTPIEPDEKPGSVLRIVQVQVDRLEREIDAFNAKLQPLNSFILPGGTLVAAQLHVARTVARRAERDVTAFAAHETINPLAIAYINRLSDHLFVLARAVNHMAGAGDVLWVPGHNRQS